MAGRLLAAASAVAVPYVAFAQWEAPKGCEDGWGADECCCMQCLSGGKAHSSFTPLSEDECRATGGQCKRPELSAFGRKGVSAPADPKHHAKKDDGEPEQVHLIGGYSDEVTVVYVTDHMVESFVEIREQAHLDEIIRVSGSSESYSFQLRPGGWNGYTDGYSHPGPWYGEMCSEEHRFTAYFNTSCMYTSAMIHTVRIRDLRPGTRYEYNPGGSSRWRPFNTPPALGEPLKIGLTADLGRTEDSLTTMRHMKDALNQDLMDLVLFPGDLAYGDGYAPAWDEYGRLGEFMWETAPTAYGVGNHEYSNGDENFANFKPRYGWPSRDRSQSPSYLWFSYEVGNAHIIMLCSYCDTKVTSLQYEWLKLDLEKVNRTRTPWIIPSWHSPWYSTSTSHDMSEVGEMRLSMEHLLFEHEVDVTFMGHMHAYERTKPVYMNKTRCDGTIHITIGDGGNHEGPNCPWQPWDFEWTARREFSFGYGILDLVNDTHGHWMWHRNQDDEMVIADEIWIERTSKRCAAGSVDLLV